MLIEAVLGLTQVFWQSFKKLRNMKLRNTEVTMSHLLISFSLKEAYQRLSGAALPINQVYKLVAPLIRRKIEFKYLRSRIRRNTTRQLMLLQGLLAQLHLTFLLPQKMMEKIIRHGHQLSRMSGTNYKQYLP